MLSGRDEDRHHILLLHCISKPIVAEVELLHPTMVFWVLGHGNRRLVVKEQSGGARKGNTKFMHEIVHPFDLLACLDS